MARKMTAAPTSVNAQKSVAGQAVDRSRLLHLMLRMKQTMAKPVTATDRVDLALTRLESMVEERLRDEQVRNEALSRRLLRLEEQHAELRKVASEVENRLERAMEYIRSLLEADQK